jgi:hypothetical protein
MHTKSLWERPVSRAIQQVLVNGLACTASSISSSPHLVCHGQCVLVAWTRVSFRLQYTTTNTSVVLLLIWILMLAFLNAALTFPSQKPYTKCILGYSTLINYTLSFHYYHYLAIRSNVGHKKMQYKLYLVMKASPHEHNHKKSLRHCNLK